MLTLRVAPEAESWQRYSNDSGSFESWNAGVSRSCQAAPEQAVGADRQSASFLKIRNSGGRSTAALACFRLRKEIEL